MPEIMTLGEVKAIRDEFAGLVLDRDDDVVRLCDDYEKLVEAAREVVKMLEPEMDWNGGTVDALAALLPKELESIVDSGLTGHDPKEDK